MGWLLLAAESRELSGLRSRCRVIRKPDWPLDFVEEWECDGRSWIAAANGPGPKRAFAAVLIAAERCSLDGVISTGYCGALEPNLEIGNIVAPERVLAPEAGREFPCASFQAPEPACRGALLSMDRVAVTASEKADLHRCGAVAVEMEAAGAASAAAELGLPFTAIRVVSDTAREDLPLDFNLFRDSDGRFRRPRIALASLGSPASVLPGLLRLDRNSRLAGQSLGDFLANCRF